MMQNSLWGDLPAADEYDTPASILKAQAIALADLTKGILYGEVPIHRQDDRLVISLLIVAPALDNYRYQVLEAEHGVDVYPVKVSPAWSFETVECADQRAFESVIQRLLTSGDLRRVIGSLLSQSRAMDRLAS